MPSRKGKYNHKRLGANLRAAGLLPKGYNLNRLTKNQRDTIVKRAHKYPGPAHRAKEFVSIKVKHSTAKKLQGAGYRVKFGKRPRAILERFGADKIRITPRGIERRTGPVTRTTLLHRRADIFDQAQKFFDHQKPGQFLMLRVGDKHEFGRNFRSMADFEKYATDWLDEHPELENELYIVEVKAPPKLTNRKPRAKKKN